MTSQRQRKEVAELGPKPWPPVPKPRVAPRDWGARTGALAHGVGAGGTREHSPTWPSWSGDGNNSKHPSAGKHEYRATRLTRGHKTPPLSLPPMVPPPLSLPAVGPRSHTITPDTVTPAHTVTQGFVLSAASLSPRRHSVRLARTGAQRLGPLPRLLSALSPPPLPARSPPPLHSSSAPSTRHLSSHLLPSLPGAGGTVYPKKLLCKVGPVATVPIRWRSVGAQTSLLLWLPCSLQSPGTPTQTFPAHGAWPACSALPAQRPWPGSAGCRQGKEAAVKGCTGGNRD